MYSYPIMHSTTFPNANIFSKEKPRTRNIHPFIHIYFFSFHLSNHQLPFRTTNYRINLARLQTKSVQKKREAAIALYICSSPGGRQAAYSSRARGLI